MNLIDRLPGDTFRTGKWKMPVRAAAAVIVCIGYFLCLQTGSLQARELTQVIILATADLHGAQQQLQQAVAPAVKREQQLHPDQVVYVDIGDTAQGTYAVNRRRGQGMPAALAQAGCEIWVPGNHELGFGFEAFKALVREFPGSVLAANLYAPELAGDFQSMKIVERSGVKIAFIGLMLKDMNNCFPVAENQFQTLSGLGVLRRQIKLAREQGADIIVLLRHAGKYGGKENLSELLQYAPEIDLVIGAHSHTEEPGCTINHIWYVQPPAHGEKLLKVKLSFDRRHRRVRQIESSLLPLPHVREDVPPALLQSAPSLIKNTSVHVIAELIQRKYHSDLALYAIGNAGKFQLLQQKKSPFLQDYYQIFPYHDPIIAVQVTAGEFRHILREYGIFAYKRKSLLSISGCQAEFRKGKLQDLRFTVQKEKYSLALSAYAAAGAGGQLPGIRRILQSKINYRQAENAPGIIEVLTSLK